MALAVNTTCYSDRIFVLNRIIGEKIAKRLTVGINDELYGVTLEIQGHFFTNARGKKEPDCAKKSVKIYEGFVH